MSPITPAADSIAAFVTRHACDPQAVVRSVAGWQRLNERHLLRAVQRRLHPSCSHAAMLPIPAVSQQNRVQL